MAKTTKIYFETDSLRYQPVTSKYLAETIAVTRSTIFKEGTMSNCLGIPQDPEALEELDKFTLSLIQDGISVIAIDKATDKVAGMVLNKIFVKNEPFYEVYSGILKTKKALQMIELRRSTLFMVNLFDVLEVDRIMEIVLLGILPEYRKRGIAKKLCELSVEIAQKLRNGINVKQALDGGVLPLQPAPDGIAVMFSSFISQKIGRELGFTIVAEHPNDKWEVHGEVILSPNIVTKTTTLECLKLK